MEIISVLIFISLMIAVGFLIVFLWSLKSGQYDDTYSPSVRMLFDDKPKAQKKRSDSNARVVLPHRTAQRPSGPEDTKGKRNK